MPFLKASRMFSRCVATIRCDGFTHDGTSQVCITSIDGGMSRPERVTETRWANRQVRLPLDVRVRRP